MIQLQHLPGGMIEPKIPHLWWSPVRDSNPKFSEYEVDVLTITP
jgi:hypothetical protein